MGCSTSAPDVPPSEGAGGAPTVTAGAVTTAAVTTAAVTTAAEEAARAADKQAAAAEKLAAWEKSLAESDNKNVNSIVGDTEHAPFSFSVGGSTHIGGKKENQDAFALEINYGGKASSLLGAVFDGHGSYGQLLAGFCCEWVVTNLHECLSGNTGAAHAMLGCFRKCEEAVHTDSTIGFRSKLSGTTATAVLCEGGELYVACVGDSRAILASEGAAGALVCKRLTRDHRPELQEERDRISSNGGVVQTSIEAAGGTDAKTEADRRGPLRVYLKGETYKDHGLDVPGPGLMITRSLGDRIAKAAGCIAEPDVEHVVLDPRSKFLVVGSDGVWDVLSDDEVVSTVMGNIDNPDAAAEAVLAKSLARWEAKQSGDNITARSLLAHPCTQ